MSQPRQAGSKRFAFLVASGIFLSRIAGLVRDRVFAHYFGLSSVADAFKAALRIPNFLQNLFGEGVLSASFIPVYASLLARGDKEEARRTAGAVAALLALTASALVLVGVLATPFMIDVIAPGFHGETRALAIRIVRILFPGVGLLVLSAWCLGILNSHHRFFLSYSAPVIWNAAMIATMWHWGRNAEDRLAIILAWGSVAGSALQVAVQLPAVLRLLGGLRLSLGYRAKNVQTVIRNFGPVFVSRGVVQISAYVDTWLASWLPATAVSALANAQTLYLLPVSLFGMSVSAAELPQMSGALGSETEVAEVLRGRLNSGLRQISFFVVPSAIAFLALGDVIVAAIYRSGRFTQADVIYVWGILAGSAVGLLASTLGRLYSSTYYALLDTRTPLRFAIVRVTLTTLLGYLCSIPLPRAFGIDPRWGVAGLTVSAGMASWVEFTLLRRTLNRRIGLTGLRADYLVKVWGAAIVAGAAGWAIHHALGTHHRPILVATLVLLPYGGLYFALTGLLGVAEARMFFGRAMSKLRGA
ncbi:MAG TPA: murein biosynthesis integral membrane protein MurJ [Candidatus Acidoferrales bacterium]|jgi:putative peptidoglycan lipid II flippase|nr:murein biosynthesis integral membrane protein MurJ [Candidatus Acidoferrales bacterium]